MTQHHTNTVAWLEEIQLHGRQAHMISGQQRGRGIEERLAQQFEKGCKVQVQWWTVMLIQGPCTSLLCRAVCPRDSIMLHALSPMTLSAPAFTGMFVFHTMEKGEKEIVSRNGRAA
jgi:hypothetical protein